MRLILHLQVKGSEYHPAGLSGQAKDRRVGHSDPGSVRVLTAHGSIFLGIRGPIVLKGAASGMFTGIIQHIGTVTALEERPWGRRLLVDAKGWAHAPRPGDSIAINGCCLTIAVDSGQGRLPFDVITETLNRTTLGDLAAGDGVNLEHALRADAMMDGHLVQGHIDGIGRIRAIQSDEADHRLRIAAPAELMEYITPKGSISINGVSLTVAGVHPAEATFEVALIPTTLDLTNLDALCVDDRVNLESDIVARTVVHWVRHYAVR